MKVNLNDISKSCFDWYVNQHYVNQYDCDLKTKVTSHDIIKDITAILNTDYETVFKKHNAFIDLIRLSYALAYINNININNWISVETTE